jgi:hypothetical protein
MAFNGPLSHGLLRTAAQLVPAAVRTFAAVLGWGGAAHHARLMN